MNNKPKQKITFDLKILDEINNKPNEKIIFDKNQIEEEPKKKNRLLKIGRVMLQIAEIGARIILIPVSM